MKKKPIAFVLALGLMASLSACGGATTPPPSAEPTPAPEAIPAVEEKVKKPLLNETLNMENMDPYGGADEVAGGNDHADSKYYINPDFYNMKNDENVTILENFTTSQQTTEYSCSANALLMSLYYFGVDKYTEYDICRMAKVNIDEDVPNAEPGTANNWWEPGANIKKVVDFISSIPEMDVIETSYIENPSAEELVSAEDVATLVYSPNMEGNIKKYFCSNALYTTDNDPESTNWVEDAKDSYFVRWVTGHLEAGHPIIVHTYAWGGHYSVLIGYDSMGTPNIGDDMLIFADGYDVSDHWQDGYTYFSLEEWFYTWNDMNIASKPYQLQPFVVVGPTA